MDHFITKYRNSGIVVDTNLLLLLYIGSTNISYIKKFKRTNTYSPEDFEMLNNLLSNFKKIIVTPHVLTEVSNLTNGLSGEWLTEFYQSYINSVEVISEEYVPSNIIVKEKGINPYGLADTGIISVAKGKFLVLTDDLRFASFAAGMGVDVINFNHLREYAWE